MTSIPFDAPDGQNAVVNAQVLLATVGANVSFVNVTLPPNVTTVAVFSEGWVGVPNVSCSGLTSGLNYPGVLRNTGLDVGDTPALFFTVSPVVDPEVQIFFNSGTPNETWYVVGLNGVNTVDVPALSAAAQMIGSAVPSGGLLTLGSDGTDARAFSVDTNGRQVPLVSTGSTGLITATTAGVTLLAAPSSGHNYLFGFDVEGLTAASIVTLSTVSGVFAEVSAPLNATASLSLNGHAVTQLVKVTTSVDTANVVLRFAIGP